MIGVIKNLNAGEDGRQEGVGVGGDQVDFGVAGGFFQSFQESVLGRESEEMGGENNNDIFSG